MKVIIAGSRHITDTRIVFFALGLSGIVTANLVTAKTVEIVSGGCRGVDKSGEEFALSYGLPYKIFHADWKGNGVAAGPMRNREMATYADALVAVWDGKSRGTKNMIEEMKRLKKPVFVFDISKEVQ